MAQALTGLRPSSHLLLAPQAEYHWDSDRRQHQIVFPEGMLVLNDTAAAILRLCDGRDFASIMTELGWTLEDARAHEAERFLSRLVSRGWIRER